MSRSIPSFFIVFLLGNIPNFVSYLLEFDEFCERIVNASSLYFLYLSISQETKSPKIVSPPLFLSVQRNIRGISSLILHPAFSSPSLRRVEQQETRRTRGASEEEEGGARQARHLATSGKSTLPRLIKSKSCASHSSPFPLHSPKSCEPTSFD